MPVSFPDNDSVARAGKRWGFRTQKNDESDELYRGLVSLHVRDKDRIESFEILFAVGWDKWTTEQKAQSLGL